MSSRPDRRTYPQHASVILVAMLVLTGFSVMVSISSPTVRGQQTIIVDQDGNGDYLTIQEGVDAANPGDTVRVWAGEYQENNIDVYGISLIGNGSAETIIDGGDDLENAFYAYSAEITDFMVTNSNFGIHLYNENRIENNYISNNSYGIFIDYERDYNAIANNTLFNNHYGILSIRATNNTIANNTVSNNEYGISLWDSFANLIYHNRLINNTYQAECPGSDPNVGYPYNKWYRPYPIGGNYWSDHTEPDEYRGPKQNEPGADGIVDKPRDVGGIHANTDRYPWTNPDLVMPGVDYLQIVDSKGSGEVIINDTAVHTEDTVVGYAAGFNESVGYVGDVDVTWSVINEEGAQAYTSPEQGDNSTFYAGESSGTAIWRADHHGITYEVEFTVLSIVDRISIVDDEGGGGSNITDGFVVVGDTITGYAAGFNDTAGYIGDVNVTWSVINEEGAQAYTSPEQGDNSTFYAGESFGTAIWRADHHGITYEVEFTIDHGIDSILIVDSATDEIVGGFIGGGQTIEGNAAAFNESIGYLKDVSATWSVENVGDTEATTSPLEGTQSVFNAGGREGTVIWTADYDGITHSVTFVIDVTPPELSILKPSDGEELTRGDITVEWSGNDDLSGISHYEVRLNNGDWINVGTSTGYTFTIDNPDDYTITVRAVDHTGNSAEERVEFRVKSSLLGTYWWVLLLSFILVIAIVMLYYKRFFSEDEDITEET